MYTLMPPDWVFLGKIVMAFPLYGNTGCGMPLMIPIIWISYRYTPVWRERLYFGKVSG